MIIRSALELAVIALILYGIYREKDLIAWENKMLRKVCIWIRDTYEAHKEKAYEDE